MNQQQTDSSTVTSDDLADALERSLRKFYGVVELDEHPDPGAFDLALEDTHFPAGTRFYCPHCGGAGPKRDKVKHSDLCWYHKARSLLFRYKREQHAQL